MIFSERHIRDALRLLLITMIVVLSCITSSRAEPVNERERPISTVAVMHCEYSPVSFWNKTTSKPSGFFVDIMDSVAARAGLKVSYICRDSWDEMIAAIESGEADIAVLLKSREREHKLLFSTPIDTTYLSFFARAESDVDPARVPSDHIVGVVKGSMSYEKLKDREGVRLQIFSGYREGLFGLLAGEISLIAGEESMVLKEMREARLEDRITKVGKPFVELQRCLVVRKDNVQLLELMNETLKGFVGGPEYQKIYLKWYGTPTPYWTNRRVLTVSGVFLIIAISGIAFWRYVSISKINKELIRTMSERNRAEVGLRESEEKFRTLFEAAVDALLIIDAQGKIIDTNRTAYESLGYTKEEILSMTITELNTEEFSGAVPERIEHLLQYSHHAFESAQRRKDGSAMPVEVNSKTMDFGGKKVFFSVIRDITERKQAEALRKESQERLLTVLNSMDAVVYVSDIKTYELLFVNNYVKDLFGNIVGQPCWKTLQAGQPGPCAFCTNDKLLDAAGNPKGIYHWEFQNTVNGRWYDIRDRALTWIDGRIVRMEIATDITERKKAEEQIKQSLREKEALLMEIHHRVKNNMAVVSSLLSLQAEKIKDATVRSLFEESQQRVKSMALVHEKLYQTKDLSSIDFEDYIRSIVSEIISLYRIDTDAIITEINIEGIELDLESAVPCGLIVNELLTNVFKHAFPDNRSGALSVHFTKTDGTYTLTIKDNGIGLPKGFDYKDTGTLGLQLVNVLTRQLRGTLQIKSDKGVEAVVTFKTKRD